MAVEGEVRLMPEVECESLVAGEEEMAGEREMAGQSLVAAEEEWKEEEPVSSTRR